MLRGLEPETNRKGIFISDADTGSADLPKGVQARFPLQLTAMPGWLPSIRPMPEKPARYSITPSTRSIWRERGRWCISRPTQTMAPLSGEPFVAEQAFKGMYRVAAAADSPLQVRLCGAGRALARVQQAAKVLKNWGLRLKSGVAPATRGWRRTPNSPTCSADSGGECHLKTCPGTGMPRRRRYRLLAPDCQSAQAIHSARFAAVGSDSRVRGEIHYPQAEWIALCALKLLADEQKILRR